MEIVHSYKYLDTTIDDKLRWDDNTMKLYIILEMPAKIVLPEKTQCLAHRQKHLICVPRFICKKCYDVRSCFLVGKSLSQKQRKTKQNIHNFLQNRYVLYTQLLYKTRTLQMATKILSDPTHFLHDHYDLLPSGRRYRMPIIKTQRALKSFIPSSIKYVNQPQKNNH